MKRYEMIKKHEDFTNIINNGKKKSGKYIIIFSLSKKFEKPNFGIAIGKKVGNAVERNKIKRQVRNIIDKNRFLFQNFTNYIKRQVRNIIDKNRFLFQNFTNYIIMIKRGINTASFNEIEEDLKKCL